jgi:hypothetical protein
MNRFGVRAVGAALLLAASGCGELPPLAPLQQNVAQIRFGVVVCGGEATGSAVPMGATCTLTVEATDDVGIPVASPSLLWSSSNTAILSASGSGATGTLTGRATGSATLTVRDRRGSASATMRINVTLAR